MDKLYVYVDESGQDTEGAYFIVVVISGRKTLRSRTVSSFLEPAHHHQTVDIKKARLNGGRPYPRCESWRPAKSDGIRAHLRAE